MKRATTDSERGLSADSDRRPHVANLVGIYAALSGLAAEQVVAQFEGRSSSDFKSALTDAIVARICPIGQEITRLQREPAHLDAVLQRGAASARGVAAATLAEVKRGA